MSTQKAWKQERKLHVLFLSASLAEPQDDGGLKGH